MLKMNSPLQVPKIESYVSLEAATSSHFCCLQDRIQVRQGVTNPVIGFEACCGSVIPVPQIVYMCREFVLLAVLIKVLH